MKTKLKGIFDRLGFKYSIVIFILFGCNQPKKEVKNNDSIAIKIEAQTAKIDSLKHEKAKIPYTRSDSARNEFWK